MIESSNILILANFFFAKSRILRLNTNLDNITHPFFRRIESLPWYGRGGSRRFGEMVDTRGTEADPDGGSREIEATRAGLDVIRLAAARSVVIIILSRLLRRPRAIVVLRGRLDRLVGGFVVVLAVVVVPQGGRLRDRVVSVYVLLRRRAISGRRVTVARKIIGEMFRGGLRDILSSRRNWSVLAIIVVVVVVVVMIVVDGRRGCSGRVRNVASSSLDVVVASLLIIVVIASLLIVSARLDGGGGLRELIVGLIAGLRAIGARSQGCDLEGTADGILLVVIGVVDVVDVRAVDVMRGRRSDSCAG